MFNWGVALAMLTASTANFAQAAVTYECSLRVFNSDNFALIDEKFTASEFGGSHAQDSNQVFSSSDGQTQVTVAIDGKWMILNWTQNGAVIANALFAVQNASQESRVAILYNPQNPDEQTALDCHPAAGL